MSQADATEILLAVREDAGPFVHLGSQFNCNGARWLGKAAASATAIYLLKKSKNTNSGHLGLAGMLLSAAFSKDDGLSTCTAADLPAPIRKQLDPKEKLGAKDIVVIAKPTVSLVKSRKFNNAIKIQAGADKFVISTSVFSMFAKPRALKAMGWTLNTELTPTAAAVHDMRGEAEKMARKTKPLWVKVLAVVGFIVGMAIYIALRVIAGH